MATFLAGLSTFPRTVLYIGAQSVGAIVGSYFLRLGLGNAYYAEVRKGIHWQQHRLTPSRVSFPDAQ